MKRRETTVQNSTPPDTRRATADPRRRGMALVLVLGLMSVLAVAIVAFAALMRSERYIARGYADAVRAENLLHVAILRAMETVDDTMEGVTYPYWSGVSPAYRADALCSWSAGSDPCPDLLTRGASNTVPRILWDDAGAAAAACAWTHIQHEGKTQGRIAYLVVNCSGLVDANVVGGSNRTDSTSVMQLSPASQTVDGLADGFLQVRSEHRRYETVAELAALNEYDRQDSSLFVYSFDPDRDAYFVITNSLGTPRAELNRRFYVNAWSNTADYVSELTNRLVAAGTPNPVAAAWNLVNYVDSDRLPQSGDACPWRDDAVYEAVPLINEIVCREVDVPGKSNQYGVAVELWYPFVPRPIAATDNARLDVALFDRALDAASPPDEDTVGDYKKPEWSFEEAIDGMQFASGSEFRVVETPGGKEISFPVIVYSQEGIPSTHYLPLGPATYQTYVPPDTNTLETITTNNSAWFLARVSIDGAWVDEAMGYDPADEAAGRTTERALMEFTNTASFSVNDPRANGRVRFWEQTASDTLGTTNELCKPLDDGGQGVPIYHRDGPMRTIGEIGQIGCSDPTNGNTAWRNIDIMDFHRGAALLDSLTVRATNRSERGLISVSTQQKDTLRVLFDGIALEYANGGATNAYPIDAEAILNAIDGPYLYMRDFASRTNALTEAMRNARPAAAPDTDYMREGVLRHITELVTFRQNLFVVIVAAQALAPDGVTPVAERRAAALVCRDAFTGRYFIRQLEPLL